MIAEDDDPGSAASRLEAALERIALAAVQPAAGQSASASPRRDAMVSSVAARLDSLIARLRDELGDTA